HRAIESDRAPNRVTPLPAQFAKQASAEIEARRRAGSRERGDRAGARRPRERHGAARSRAGRGEVAGGARRGRGRGGVGSGAGRGAPRACRSPPDEGALRPHRWWPRLQAMRATIEWMRRTAVATVIAFLALAPAAHAAGWSGPARFAGS